MIHQLTSIYNTFIGRLVFFIPKKIYDFYLYQILSDKELLKRRFKRVFGYNLNISEPKTLNEKLQWKKLYDRNPLYTNCADKIKVRSYVKEKIGEKYLIKLYGTYKKAEYIDFSKIPRSFMLKSNHGSGQILIIQDKDTINKNKLFKTCNKWLKEKHFLNTKEIHYKNISPELLIEELLIDEIGNVPFDYKFHCFNGVVKAIQVDLDRFSNHKRSFYDEYWKKLPFQWCLFKNNTPLYEQGDYIPEPPKLKEMINVSKLLSKDFNYVRVDLYHFNNKIYFGELTFNHGSGYEQFEPSYYDRVFGDYLSIIN